MDIPKGRNKHWISVMCMFLAAKKGQPHTLRSKGVGKFMRTGYYFFNLRKAVKTCKIYDGVQRRSTCPKRSNNFARCCFRNPSICMPLFLFFIFATRARPKPFLTFFFREIRLFEKIFTDNLVRSYKNKFDEMLCRIRTFETLQKLIRISECSGE